MNNTTFFSLTAEVTRPDATAQNYIPLSCQPFHNSSCIIAFQIMHVSPHLSFCTHLLTMLFVLFPG
ncbi:hypothetical protein T4D_15717 [Trichinella pseudospiralis]|uniref:Uncharacterized protein n=1 Tax=Trichinella pseudospiralis TaxID=6337 RepID=A0A0V1FLG0_TRIPS|nr:hypothetical protein T4D_15717 [Trichinella pseudospiralis]